MEGKAVKRGPPSCVRKSSFSPPLFLLQAVVALSDSRHYNAVDQDLKTVSLMSDLLNPKCPMDAALNMVPTTTDILCLYLGQDDATMYVAVRITETPQASCFPSIC